MIKVKKNDEFKRENKQIKQENKTFQNQLTYNNYYDQNSNCSNNLFKEDDDDYKTVTKSNERQNSLVNFIK